MVEIQITREMWDEWRTNPVTNLFFKDIVEKKQFLIEYLTKSVLQGSEYPKTVGMIQALGTILDVSYVEGEESND